MKAVVLRPTQWNAILTKLKSTEKPSTLLIRSSMKSTLGFTPRDHQRYDKDTDRYISEVHVDFYNEHARTLFLLKYSGELVE